MQSTNYNDYAFASGGMIWKVLDRTHLSEKNIRYKVAMILLLIVLSWLPLAFLSWYQLGPNDYRALFVRDVSTHVRFFVVFPMLLIARHIVNKGFNKMVAMFYETQIVNEENHEHFEEVIRWMVKWRNSLLVDIILLVLVYIAFFSQEMAEVNKANYHTPWLIHDHAITWAGWWYLIFGLPLLQMVVYRWLYTTVLWIIFLRRISRVKLNLSALHPDGMGGLGFLKYTQLSFFLVALAFSSLVAGALNNIIIFTNASILDFKLLIVTLFILIALLFILPLMVFVPLLARVKERYFFEYSKDAWQFAREYERELKEYQQTGKTRPDTSWHIDLIGSFEKASQMKLMIVDRTILIVFATAVILPFLPVIAQQIPLRHLFFTLITKFL
jgi:hypothetical protein